MRCFGMMIDGRAQATGIKQRGSDTTVLLVLNAHYDVVEFTLPASAEATGWNMLFDTNIPDTEKPEEFPVGAAYEVTCRSFVAFQLKTT
jgi:isoamylase